ncbi:MAG: hypothetical protein U0469_02910 [Candidatus Paceibacterota bacterium]
MNLEIREIADLRAILLLEDKLSRQIYKDAQKLLISHRDANKEDWINIIENENSEPLNRDQAFSKMCRETARRDLPSLLKRLVSELEDRPHAANILEKAKEYLEHFEDFA